MFLQTTREEMTNRKIQTYQNQAKNLCTIVFDLDSEGKFTQNKTLQLLKKHVPGCHMSWTNRKLCILTLLTLKGTVNGLGLEGVALEHIADVMLNQSLCT